MNKADQLHHRVVELELKAQAIRWTLLKARDDVGAALEQLDEVGYEIVKEHAGIDELFYPANTNSFISRIRDRWDLLRLRFAW